MNNPLQKVLDLFRLSGKKEISIIGKGRSFDALTVNRVRNSFIININDSEQIVAGDIAIFYHDWVLNYLQTQGAQCDLYLTDHAIGNVAPHIILDRVYNDPENTLPTQSRFFDRDVKIEDAVLITALKLANWLADTIRERLTVYMLGFDFTLDAGYSAHLGEVFLHDERSFAENLLSTQEAYLNFILSHKNSLAIDVVHVGSKPYSRLTTEQYNAMALPQSTVLSSSLSTPMMSHTVAESTFDSSTFRVKVVAEITTNHFGDLQLLKNMIHAAKAAGADYIKLQKRDVDSFYSQEQLDQPYTSPFGNTFRDYRHGLELDEFGFRMVNKWCKEVGIGWFASVLDLPSYEFIKQFNPELIKLPSTISEHTDYLSAVAQDFTNDIVLSTGMTDESYEQFVIDKFTACRHLYLLQCVSSYPTKLQDANVAVVQHYHNLSLQHSKIIPGYSSHDIGSLCSMLAVGAGALMIEKHVKYGNTPWAHFDNVAIDMLTDNFKNFVDDIRQAEICMGSSIKEVLQTEHHKYKKTILQIEAA